MIKVKQLYRAVRDLKRGRNLGDAALLKADALGSRAAPEVEAQLEGVRGYLPTIDLRRLKALPEGSFGRTYALYMERHALAPFVVGAGLEDVVKRNVFAVRYAVTHDIFHLLLGFDTTLAGEIGVLAFAAAQGYSRSLRVALFLARVLYPVLAPRQIRAIRQNARRGWERGKQAAFLLGVRFEERWEAPFDAVKSELRVA
jgi:ubiquinone biosynthesis protein Coq4